MDELKHDDIKNSVLDYIKTMFEEMEEEMAMSHQEKYALLEDAFENAGDPGELRIAFEQWYAEHSNDVNFEYEMEELWDHALNQLEA